MKISGLSLIGSCLTSFIVAAGVGWSEGLQAQPLNDDFDSAIALAGSSATTNASNVGATGEAAEPNHGNSGEVHSVWWKWTAPFSGEVDLIITSAEFSALSKVYIG